MSKESDLYERWCEARLKEAEAELKELKAERALNAARKAHLKARELALEGFNAWNDARLAEREGSGHAQ